MTEFVQILDLPFKLPKGFNVDDMLKAIVKKYNKFDGDRLQKRIMLNRLLKSYKKVFYSRPKADQENIIRQCWDYQTWAEPKPEILNQLGEVANA